MKLVNDLLGERGSWVVWDLGDRFAMIGWIDVFGDGGTQFCHWRECEGVRETTTRSGRAMLAPERTIRASERNAYLPLAELPAFLEACRRDPAAAAALMAPHTG